MSHSDNSYHIHCSLITDNNILAINIKKANEILSAKGIYFPSDKSIVSSNYNISQSNEKVNTPYLDFLTLPEGVIHYDDSIAYTASSERRKKCCAALSQLYI